MNFHDTRFPIALSLGSSGGIERRTEIVSLVNGFEERNTPWELSRRRYDAGIGVRSLDDLDRLVAFFEARRGRLYGFRWRDAIDWKSCVPSAEISATDQSIGTGDGAESIFALTKTYGDAVASHVRPITKPVGDSVRVAVDGVEVPFGIDVTDGRVILATPPAAGAEVTAGFAFDVPVRFDTDLIEVNLTAFEAGEIPSVPVVEVRV